MREIVAIEEFILRFLDKKDRIRKMPVAPLRSAFRTIEMVVDSLCRQWKTVDDNHQKRAKINAEKYKALAEKLEQQDSRVIWLNSELQTARQAVVELERVPGRAEYKELRTQKFLFEQREKQVEQLEEKCAEIDDLRKQKKEFDRLADEVDILKAKCHLNEEKSASLEKWKSMMIQKEGEYKRVIDKLKAALEASEKISQAARALVGEVMQLGY